MTPLSIHRWIAIGLLTLAVGCNVNQSIHLADGESITGSFKTVNGSVHVGRQCEVGGDCKTVNGSVKIGDESKVHSIGTINGSITIGSSVEVLGDVKTINGGIESGSGSRVQSEVSTINGSIKLKGTAVEGNVGTINGSIILDQGSKIGGDLVIGKNKGNSNQSEPLIVEIKNGSAVMGDVINNNDRIKIEVHLDPSSRVEGEMIGAEVIRHEGEWDAL